MTKEMFKAWFSAQLEQERASESFDKMCADIAKHDPKLASLALKAHVAHREMYAYMCSVSEGK
jgi:hypothetical protein